MGHQIRIELIRKGFVVKLANRYTTRSILRRSIYSCCGICSTSHRTWKCGTRPFFGGSGRRAVANTRPAFAKNAYGPVGIPHIRGASGAGRLTQPHRREKKPGGRPPEAEGNYPSVKTHSVRSVPAASTASRNASLLFLLRYLLTTPPNGQVWHKAFFMVGPDEGP